MLAAGIRLPNIARALGLRIRAPFGARGRAEERQKTSWKDGGRTWSLKKTGSEYFGVKVSHCPGTLRSKYYVHEPSVEARFFAFGV